MVWSGVVNWLGLGRTRKPFRVMWLYNFRSVQTEMPLFLKDSYLKWNPLWKFIWHHWSRAGYQGSILRRMSSVAWLLSGQNATLSLTCILAPSMNQQVPSGKRRQWAGIIITLVYPGTSTSAQFGVIFFTWLSLFQPDSLDNCKHMLHEAECVHAFVAMEKQH